MTLDLLWTIILYCLASLALLAVLVIWVVILASVWFGVSKFLTQYQESKKALAIKEQQEQQEQDVRYAGLTEPDI